MPALFFTGLIGRHLALPYWIALTILLPRAWVWRAGPIRHCDSNSGGISRTAGAVTHIRGICVLELPELFSWGSEGLCDWDPSGALLRRGPLGGLRVRQITPTAAQINA